MKPQHLRLALIVFFVALGSIACSNFTSQMLSLPSPTPTISLPPNATPIPSEWRFWDTYPMSSPDGKWQVHLGDKQPISVTAVADSSLVILDQAPIGEYSSFESWFPDNSGFIVLDADHGCEKCPWDRLNMYHIDAENKMLSRYTFEPASTPPQTAFWSEVSWSPDGSQLAVIVNQQEIVLLDKYAKVQHEIKPKLRGNQQLDQIFWANFGLVYTVRNVTSDNSPQSSEIRQVDLTNLAQQEQVLTQGADDPFIMDSDPFSHRLMVKHDVRPPDARLGWMAEVAIFNTDTRQYEESIYVYGSWTQYPYFNYAVSDNHQLVALQLGNDEDNFFIFDWKTGEMTKKAITVDDILRWRQDLQSFIVVRSGSPTKTQEWLESVR